MRVNEAFARMPLAEKWNYRTNYTKQGVISPAEVYDAIGDITFDLQIQKEILPKWEVINFTNPMVGEYYIWMDVSGKYPKLVVNHKGSLEDIGPMLIVRPREQTKPTLDRYEYLGFITPRSGDYIPHVKAIDANGGAKAVMKECLFESGLRVEGFAHCFRLVKEGE